MSDYCIVLHSNSTTSYKTFYQNVSMIIPYLIFRGITVQVFVNLTLKSKYSIIFLYFYKKVMTTHIS